MKNILYLAFAVLLGLSCVMFTFAQAKTAVSTEKPTNSGFDAELAKRLGADKLGMRNYILVILKTGPVTVAPGKERDEIFKGHFANIHRLADEGKLVVAGAVWGQERLARNVYFQCRNDRRRAKADGDRSGCEIGNYGTGVSQTLLLGRSYGSRKHPQENSRAEFLNWVI
jgi:hypothetical protein